MAGNITNLSEASSAAIRTALSNMRSTYNARNAWINTAGNRYIADALGQLKSDFRNGTIDNRAITDYVASSICIHCFNGWSYLSTAVTALLEGDYGNAIHNAYYAELRTMMSFLATQGIGVFDGQNVLIDQAGVAKFATPHLRTHVFAKTAFDQWLNTPGNSESLLKLLVIENYSLDDWLNSTGFSPASELPGKVAKGWFKDWSVDLSIIEDEQQIRNFVSYRPQCFDESIPRLSDNVETRLQFIAELWKLCAPEKLFDHSILRTTLEVLYKELFDTNLLYLDVNNDWKRHLTDLGMNPNDQSSQYLINFFRRQIEPANNQVFDRAKNITFNVPVQESDTEPMGIISRACLLLLITTKVIETIMRQTGTSRANLQFWYSNIGLKTGYWESGNEPALFSDLWLDVEEELGDLKSWLNSPGAIRSPYTLQRDLRKRIPHINQLSRAYLWGIGA
jgi:hypothetical protein